MSQPPPPLPPAPALPQRDKYLFRPASSDAPIALAHAIFDTLHDFIKIADAATKKEIYRVLQPNIQWFLDNPPPAADTPHAGFLTAMATFARDPSKEKDPEGFAIKIFFSHYFPSSLTSGSRDGPTAIISDAEKESATSSSAATFPSIADRPSRNLVLNIADVKPTNEGAFEFYNKLLGTLKADKIQYYMDAFPLKRTILCMKDKVPATFYNGIARNLDPGTRGAVSIVDEEIRNAAAKCPDAQAPPTPQPPGSASASAAPAQVAPLQSPEVTLATVGAKAKLDTKTFSTCLFSPGTRFTLSKNTGELLLFHEMTFRDKCPPNQHQATVSVRIGRAKVNLNIHNILNLGAKDRGKNLFYDSILTILEHSAPTATAAGPATRGRKVITDLRQRAFAAIISGFRINFNPEMSAIDPPRFRPSNSSGKAFFDVNDRDYMLALFDFKRSGDAAQGAAARAALDNNPPGHIPLFISLDRMAILYALYRKVPSMYVSAKKDIVKLIDPRDWPTSGGAQRSALTTARSSAARPPLPPRPSLAPSARARLRAVSEMGAPGGPAQPQAPIRFYSRSPSERRLIPTMTAERSLDSGWTGPRLPAFNTFLQKLLALALTEGVHVAPMDIITYKFLYDFLS